MIDSNVRRKLNLIITKITKTSKKSIDEELFKEVKSIVKQSNDYVKCAYDQIFKQLREKNSLIRYHAVLLCNEFVNRSAHFRSLLCEDFQQFMSLTVGTDITVPLPPPNDVAAELRKLTLEYIENWNEKFGPNYKQIRLGYRYLKNTLKLNFPEIRASAEARRKAEEDRQAETQRLLRVKYEQLKHEIDEHFTNIISNVKKMDSCFQILVPGIAGVIDDNDKEEPAANNNNNNTATSSSSSSSSSSNNNPNSGINESVAASSSGSAQGEYNQQQQQPSASQESEEWETVDVDSIHDLNTSTSSSISFASTAATDDSSNENNNDYDNGTAEQDEDEGGVAEFDGDDDDDTEESRILRDYMREYEYQQRVMNTHELGFREQGLGSSQYEITIEVRKRLDDLENKENKVLFDTLCECYQELTKSHDAMVKDWMSVLMRIKIDPNNTREKQVYDRLVRKVIDLKGSVVACKKKCEELGIAQKLQQHTKKRKQQSATPPGKTSSSKFSLLSPPSPSSVSDRKQQKRPRKSI